jgi:nucleotide-binding universal stress UspA family protein
MFKSILVAIDGSKPAKRASVVGVDMAKRCGAQLRFITAIRRLPTKQVKELKRFMEAEHLAGSPYELASDRVQRMLNEAATYAREKGVKDVRTVAYDGDAAGVILSQAKRHRADLIVLGSRGLGAVQGLLLGSVSQKVVSLADCTVMTVR